jgi:hypothetical protein
MISADPRHSLRTPALLTLALALFLATAISVVDDGGRLLPTTVVAAQAQ